MDVTFLNRRQALCLGGMVALPGCASSPSPGADLDAEAVAAFLGPQWHHFHFPGKRDTRYSVSKVDQTLIVSAEADSSASMLRRTLSIAGADVNHIRFSWRVPALIEGADLRDRDAEDSPVRIVLAFDGDRSKLSGRDQMLSELAQTLTGEPMPYATLMYVWDNQAALESVIPGNRTHRIRKIVVDSGPALTKVWRLHERDIAADYQRAFGEAPGVLTAVALMTDTDNTHSKIRAFYGEVRLTDRLGKLQ